MSKPNNIAGFTLIELIVVICIISSLLMFSFPLFKDIGLFSSSGSQVGHIVRLINDLKKRAVERRMDFILHLDTGDGIVWVTDETMDDESKENARTMGFELSGDFSVLDVEFPSFKAIGAFEHQIMFRKQGYSDFVVIRIVEGENNITIKIEPFLWQAQLLYRHTYLEGCI